MKRLAYFLLAGFTLLAVGVGLSVLFFVRGTAGVDDWVVRRVVAIVETYIVPRIDFRSFDFQPPRSLTLEGVRLTAPDGTRVVEADELRLTLVEVPQRGRPIAIERIELERPVLNLIAEPGRPGLSASGYKGLDPFVKSSNVQNQQSVPEDVRLSSVLRIHTVRLSDATVTYDPADGDPAMSLSGLSLELDVQPDAAGGDPGWYALSTRAGRAPLLTMDITGRFNVDSLVAEFASLTLETSLDSEESYAALPPAPQRFLREHDVRGQARLTAAGRLPLRDWRAADLQAEATLLNAHFAAGEGRIPIDRAAATLAIREGAARFAPIDIDLLRGSIDADAVILLRDHDLPASLRWEARSIDLRETLRTQARPGETPRLAGLVSSTGEANFSPAHLPSSLNGGGRLRLSEGRLLIFPFVRELAETVGVLGEFLNSGAVKDTLDVAFTLTAESVRIDSFDLRSDAIAARGSGHVRYDGTIDMSVNAGPLERVQGMLGKVGSIIGKVTDRLVTYRVSGRIGDPTVTVQPLGMGE